LLQEFRDGEDLLRGRSHYADIEGLLERSVGEAESLSSDDGELV
jgi:hypothetical protein